jgi:hypothetical protein
LIGGEANMFDTPAIVIGFTGAAFLIGSLAPVALESRERPTAVAISSKGDRLPVAAAASPARAVTTIEVVGLSEATIVFKDRTGQVLFRSDPLTGTTVVARNVDIPVVTLKMEPTLPPTVPVVRQPEAPREGGDSPVTQPRSRKPIGCEAPVSALARSDAGRIPGLCLASVSHFPSS